MPDRGAVEAKVEAATTAAEDSIVDESATAAEDSLVEAAATIAEDSPADAAATAQHSAARTLSAVGPASAASVIAPLPETPERTTRSSVTKSAGDARDVASMTARRRHRLWSAASIVVALAIALPLWAEYGDTVRAFNRGEIDWRGDPRYVPEHPVDRAALRAIDFARLHRERIPAWTVALGRMRHGSGRARAELAYRELAAEVAIDRNLADLFAATHRALVDDPIEHAERLDYLLWAYNRYLERNGIPWRLEASLVLREHGRAVLHTLSYEVLLDRRNARGHRVRLLRRADALSSVEGWMGHTGRGDEGALVLMQQVLHFTIRHVWPALHPALDTRRPPNERPWLGYVRDEVRAQLDPRTYALLAESAVDQQTLIEVAQSIAERAECGSRFRIRRLPYNGLAPAARRALTAALARSDPSDACPEVTLDEAARIVGASERLASSAGLREAIESLTTVVARAVAAHELQHADDGDDVECLRCPPRLRGLARAEASAYLAALSTEGLGYLALLQACATPRGEGVHGAALSGVLDAVLPLGCEGPTLHGLYDRAERIETALFGKRGDVHVPQFPNRVALLPRTAPEPRQRPRAWPLEDGWGLRLRPPPELR